VSRGYADIEAALRRFLAEAELRSPPATAAVRALAAKKPRPLNVVIVPQSLLNKPELWPDYVIDPKSTYPSRYVPNRATLFVADTPGFERKELPYGVALHALAPVAELSNEDCLLLAEKFEAYYLSRFAK
jgi:hypothetical protein